MPSERPDAKSIAGVKFYWVNPTVAAALALMSCYGTLAFVGALSFLGVTIGIYEGIWAATIVAFYALAVGLIMFRGSRSLGPTLIGVVGFAAIMWAMSGVYNWMTELAAFALLVVATTWDRVLLFTASYR